MYDRIIWYGKKVNMIYFVHFTERTLYNRLVYFATSADLFMESNKLIYFKKKEAEAADKKKKETDVNSAKKKL